MTSILEPTIVGDDDYVTVSASYLEELQVKEQEVEDNEAQIDALLVEIGNIRTKNQMLQLKLLRLGQSKLDSVTTKSAEDISLLCDKRNLEDELAFLKVQHESLAQHVSKIEKENSKLKKRLHHTELENGKLRAKSDKLTLQVAQHQTSIATLQREVTDRNALISEQGNSINQLLLDVSIVKTRALHELVPKALRRH